jgi:mRNA interferase YafQ
MRLYRTSSFKKDYKKMQKRGKVIEKLDEVILKLAYGKKLEAKYRDHALLGYYKGRRECHLEPDWLLLYKLDKDEIILERTGTHSDLFE